MIQIARAYDSPEQKDGERYLVDRLWPRGIKKEDLQVVEWLKEVAPSVELRSWFGHEAEKWDEFQRRYFAELEANPEAWWPLLQAAQEGSITLVYGAKDRVHNNAAALKAFLERKFDQRQPARAGW